MSSAEVWVAKNDGVDIVRSDAIVGVGRDYNGNITARLSGCEHALVTLVTGNAHVGPHTPDDFHLQLLRVITRLSDAAEPVLVRPTQDDQSGWSWQTETL